ncbi:hypothetical protein Tco_0946583, partial [Tanacetum coccineum]
RSKTQKNLGIFHFANKKCIVDAEVFRKILDICPRVEGEEFTEVQDNEATLTFLIDLGYKGPLHKYTSKENIDYLELILEDITFLDHRREKKSRRETMPFPRFTKVIINHLFSQHKSLSKLKFQHYHTIKDDGIVSRLKFVRIREDYQEYGLPIPDMMLNDKIKNQSPYQMFLNTPPIEPKPAKKKTGSISTRGVVIQDTPNIMQALKESKKTSKRQPSSGGSNKGTSRIPRVLGESTIVFATSSEGTGTKLGVPDEEKVTSQANIILERGSEQESGYS